MISWYEIIFPDGSKRKYSREEMPMFSEGIKQYAKDRGYTIEKEMDDCVCVIYLKEQAIISNKKI